MLKAFSTQVTSSEFHSVMYPGGLFNLAIFLQWIQITHSLKGSMPGSLWDMVNAGRRLKAGTWHLPLGKADEIVVGKPVKFWRDWLQHTSFFVRLCDVHPDGKSMNVCDRIQRLSPGKPEVAAGGIRRLIINLWPTAYRFRKGHRLRVQVSSGAFPRFARNLGTEEPLATGTTMRVAGQQIYHEPTHPSAIILPVSHQNE
jgi:hypothetical protein